VHHLCVYFVEIMINFVISDIMAMRKLVGHVVLVHRFVVFFADVCKFFAID